ncbi:protein regulator of cytokinesis 1-like isoform X2 [Carassius carassius]|uniref:protein regulator of cytokinesis 1-like isoform X2 n=1 Tax=Carassius carassius TaxID=217509 RepID=UPI0028686059|nr:protein regulator of cytokinesis 1-like isoform X2 [Carassius carassius]
MRKSEVIAAESVACLNKALCHLKDIWEEIGIPEDQRLERTNVVKNHVKSLLDMMIVEEESLRKRLRTSIDKCQKELSHLCLELQLPPFQEDRSSTMLQQEKDLRMHVEVMLKEKNQRMQALKALTDQDQDLCDLLCFQPFSVSAGSVPSLEQLENFRQHISSLTAEKERRHKEFVALKKQIILCMDDLDQLPETSFEKDVVCEDEESFCLSKENIDSLKVLLHQLESRKAENKRVCGSYREKIHELWERLQTPQEERDAMCEHMTLSKQRNMQALQAEVRRLEELKLKNIQNVTEAIRNEIAVFWDKCFYSSDQRQAFVPFYDDDFSEELLSLHDAEIVQLKQYYEDHKDLFEGVHKWEESWRLFLELEEKAKDPSRFTNRGGNLLKEEKQRADLVKSLPKLEKKLKAEIEQWEHEQNREFQVNGQKFMQFVTDQWESYRLEKEREKQERQLKKSKQTEVDMVYGTVVRTPTKRRFLGSTTPCKARKQGNVRTPGHGKPPHQGLLERNKENICHLTGGVAGMAKRDLSKSSKSKHVAEILNSTIIQL